MQLLNTILLSATLLGGAVETPPSTEIVEEETTEVEEKDDGLITLEDKDKNGIPDNLEEYYKKNIQDQWLFGISLGSVISFGITVLGLVYNRIKEKAHQKKIEANSNVSKEKIEELEKRDGDREKAFEEDEKKRQAQLDDFKKTTTECLLLFKEASKKLSNYANVERKINACIRSIEALSKSDDFMAQGITEEIEEIINEVR